MTATNFTIVDPSYPGMMDSMDFTTATPVRYGSGLRAMHWYWHKGEFPGSLAVSMMVRV